MKAILFDIDNTLFPSNDFAELARRNAINAMIEAGLNADSEEAYCMLRKVIEKYGPNYPKHFNILLKEFGTKPDPKIIAAGIVAYHQAKTSIFPFPPVPTTVLQLREQGYLVCVASEGRVLKQWDKLIRLGLHNLFHEVFVTSRKSKKFYKSILKRLKLPPHEVMMVGDSIEKDIKPAKQLGIITVLVAQKPSKVADYHVKNIGELPKILERLQ